MDYNLSITKISHLFWLGRYTARVDTTLRYLAGWYDTMLDGKPIDYRGFCQSLDIPCPYTNPHNFMRSYIFDKKNPDSIRAAAESMLGNGMVLRQRYPFLLANGSIRHGQCFYQRKSGAGIPEGLRPYHGVCGKM